MEKLPLTCLMIQGPDASTFLQGQLSVDVFAIEPSQSALFCLCNLKGRVIVTGKILTFSKNEYALFIASNMVSVVIAHLQKYGRFSKITISINDKAVIDSRYPSDLIREGIAFIDALNTESFTPHEINYVALGAVSFDKGCYLGQEIITRMQFLGNLKKHLHFIEGNSDTILAPKQILHLATDKTKSVGEIVNVVNDAENHYLALAILQDTVVEGKLALAEMDG